MKGKDPILLPPLAKLVTSCYFSFMNNSFTVRPIKTFTIKDIFISSKGFLLAFAISDLNLVWKKSVWK